MSGFLEVPVIGRPVTDALPYSVDMDRWHGHRDACPQCAHLGYGAHTPCLTGLALLTRLKYAISAMHTDALLN